MTHPRLLLLKGERKCENNLQRRTGLCEPSKNFVSSLSTLASVLQVLGEKTIRVGDNNNKKVYERKIVKILSPDPLRPIEMHP